MVYGFYILNHNVFLFSFNLIYFMQFCTSYEYQHIGTNVNKGAFLTPFYFYLLVNVGSTGCVVQKWVVTKYCSNCRKWIFNLFVCYYSRVLHFICHQSLLKNDLMIIMLIFGKLKIILTLSHPEALPWQVKLSGVRQRKMTKGMVLPCSFISGPLVVFCMNCLLVLLRFIPITFFNLSI